MEVVKQENSDEAYELSYQPRPPLQKPGTYLRDIKYLIKAMDDDEIDVNPEYQREVVWTADRMSQLVDSLMENFYVPPIILNRQKDPVSGKSILVCVDGKQRLSSVKAFAQGIIPCHDKQGEKWWFRNAHVSGKKKKILSPAMQEEFLNKDFVTFEFTDLKPEQEEDLFARVQMGMPLSTAEKMRATSGPWQELAKHFTTDFPDIYSLQKDRMRAKDFQLTLACFSQIVEVQHPTPADGTPMYKAGFQHLPKLVDKNKEIDDNLKSHLANVWKTMQELIGLDPDTFTNNDKRLKGVKTFAPVEMVAVTVLISMYSETRSNQILLEDIRSLRDSLRENFTDLRTNSLVWKAVWSFLDNLDKNRPVGEVITTVQDALSTPRALPSRPAPAPAPAASGPKRGRPTLRKKPQTIVPETSDNSTTGNPESTGLDPEGGVGEPRSRKRPRTGPNDFMAGQNKLTTPPIMPAEVRQNRRAELESFRAPVAPMGLDVDPSTSVPGASVPQSPVNSRPKQRTTIRRTIKLPRQDEVRLSQSTPQIRKIKKQRATIPQGGAIVDLTDEEPVAIEQHRVELLSTFR